MKAILISIMVLSLVGALVGTGLFAYFSDTITSENNTFEAGTIDIDALFGPIVYNDNATDAKPCETVYEYDVVTNTGRNDLDLWKHIIIVDDPADLAEVTYFDLAVDWDGDTDGDGVLEYEDEIIPDETVFLYDVACNWVYIGVIPAIEGNTVYVRESFHIMADAGDEYQGAVITFQKEYYGGQLLGAVPGNELAGYGRP